MGSLCILRANVRTFVLKKSTHTYVAYHETVKYLLFAIIKPLWIVHESKSSSNQTLSDSQLQIELACFFNISFLYCFPLNRLRWHKWSLLKLGPKGVHFSYPKIDWKVQTIFRCFFKRAVRQVVLTHDAELLGCKLSEIYGKSCSWKLLWVGGCRQNWRLPMKSTNRAVSF